MEHPETSPVRGARLAFRKDLEGVRGVAILLVVAYHTGLPGVGGGYVGVDVFFVLSGYLITGLLVKELETTGRLNFIEFYARRARRLLPASAIVLAVTLLAARFVYAPFEQQGFTGTALATAAYISNVWFAKESTNYLAADSVTNPFLHTWSLAVEEQFYLVWPLLLAVTSYWSKGRSRSHRLAVTMSALAIVSFLAAVWLTGVAQPLAFFSSPTRAWEFAIGGLGALPTQREQRGAVRGMLSWVGIGAVCGAALFFDRSTGFPGVAALIPVLGTAAVLVFPTPSLTLLLSSSPLQWLGRLSYSWYLWHWPVLTIGEALVSHAGLFVRFCFASVALLLAWMTFVWLEHPIRSSRVLGPRPRWSLAMAACITICSIGFAWQVRTLARRSAETPIQRAFTLAWNDVPKVYASGCHLGYLDRNLRDCTFGDRHADVVVVLFGDSHAAQWFPPLEHLALEWHWKLVPLTKSACPAATVERIDPALGRNYVECTTWRRAAMDRIIQLAPRAVVVASAGAYVTENNMPGGVTEDQWFHGTLDTLSRLSGAGLKTLLIRDTPVPGFDVPACLARAAWNPLLFSRACTFDRAASRNVYADRAEASAAAEVPGVSVLDPSAAICGASTCNPWSNDLVVYRDTHHLTTQFATSLWPLISTKLDEVGLLRVK